MKTCNSIMRKEGRPAASLPFLRPLCQRTSLRPAAYSALMSANSFSPSI